MLHQTKLILVVTLDGNVLISATFGQNFDFYKITLRNKQINDNLTWNVNKSKSKLILCEYNVFILDK